MVALVTLSRPKVRNAFDETMIAEITDVFRRLAKIEALRVIVLTSTGPAFCAGADLNWMRKMAGYAHGENLADAMKLAEMLHAVDTCPQPVIARVQGDAFAGGLGLVSTADIVIAEKMARLCLSEVRLGLLPATISPYVIRAIGEQAARRYFLTAEVFDAVKGYELGLVHEAVSMDELDNAVNTLVDALVRNSPQAVRECKRMVREVAGRPLNRALMEDTAGRIAEGKEGVQAFLEKREPAWRNSIVELIHKDE
ncbi:MAG: enoyl-CoA hydratase/isomerase family protein [Candidatus Protistobacter heckmanni]|nr:enoyl-CoA hydratase/isomerase family protein [Candidatus Protistobacter heckmanni]